MKRRKRNKILKIRLFEEELRWLDEQKPSQIARAVWARELLFKHQAKRNPIRAKTPSVPWLNQLVRVGVNLNQLTREWHRARMRSWFPAKHLEETNQKLKEATQALKSLLAELSKPTKTEQSSNKA